MRDLENEMTATINLTSFWRFAGKLENAMLKRHVARHISSFKNLIVVLFFATCYLTFFIDGSRKYVNCCKQSCQHVQAIYAN